MRVCDEVKKKTDSWDGIENARKEVQEGACARKKL
jgi:hypothetical protein